MTTTWTVTEATAPESLDHPDAWALHGIEAVSRACVRSAWGHEDTVYRAASAAARLRDQTYTRRSYFVVTPAEGVGDPSAVAGFGFALMPIRGNAHLAEIEVWVHPDQRGQGLGTLLLATAEDVAVAAGRRTLLAPTEHAGEAAADDTTALVPPTGAGRIRAEDPLARFAQRHGYELGQGERYSVLRLPLPDGLLDGLHAEAARAAGDDYRLVRWTERAPDELVDGLAVLFTRMSTDAPSADLDIREEPWTADRVRTYERLAAEAGRGLATVGAVHVGTGTLAAMTVVERAPDAPESLDQGDTIVLPEHRGHRLGMLVKAEMLRFLADLAPRARRVHTWNAEENAYMLAINVALGFRPEGVIGLWQKRLD
ncbi:GNAT family N-acetyltransferase [Actinotalea sp. M2MS4P-6]|uniref:GNAT family N-acetyltransferase n=1 Tax=Actinotalea sp. M2MS4P-6 TaxID=2983762 RepID=UPI0021E3BCBC|nr:GNAT family N-acetyltransferase [Actinotalea sp. M2MS4P-6]MCV2393000.1 GNAT family N-acetyltransferase [Actinotalea sp. M2MS4P-6]